MIKNFLEKPMVAKTLGVYMNLLSFFERWGMSLMVLGMRLWMAKIFWYSGLTKIASWDSTLMLFKYEYQVPIIPHEFAALSATAFELACPVLLTLGILARFATLPMLAMTAVIQFTYLDLIDHTYWAMLLGTIFLFGPGYFSLDHLFKRRFVR